MAKGAGEPAEKIAKDIWNPPEILSGREHPLGSMAAALQPRPTSQLARLPASGPGSDENRASETNCADTHHGFGPNIGSGLQPGSGQPFLKPR